MLGVTEAVRERDRDWLRLCVMLRVTERVKLGVTDELGDCVCVCEGENVAVGVTEALLVPLSLDEDDWVSVWLPVLDLEGVRDVLRVTVALGVCVTVAELVCDRELA